MNEQIKELAEQAGGEFWQRLENGAVNPEAYVSFDPPESLEKFVRLIVSECADIAKHHVMNISTYADAEFVERQIKENFGVEE